MNPCLRIAARPSVSRAQQGVATLTVVMVLFFIVSLVAAYTSRNLIFEQRTSANLYRSMQAFEAAEAGIEWAITQLNGGRVDDTQCQPPPPGAVTTDDTFRDRYLDIDADSGNISVRKLPDDSYRDGNFWPTCVFDGNQWKCVCPVSTAMTVAAPTGPGPFPAFRVRMRKVPLDPLDPPLRPGIVRVEVNGCTSLGNAAACLAFQNPDPDEPAGQGARATSGEGLATVSVVVALKSALSSPPAAPLTARDDIATREGRVQAKNQEASTGGVTLHAGGGVIDLADLTRTPLNRAGIEDHFAGGPSGSLLITLPGTPIDSSVVRADGVLKTAPPPGADAATTAFYDGLMFASVFGMWRPSFDAQSTVLACKTSLDTCTTSDITELLRLNPGRTVRVPGNLQIDAPLGTAAAPVLVVVDGTLTITSAAGVIHGLVYTQSGNVTVEGPVEWNGALVADKSLSINTTGPGTDADLKMNYDLAVLKLLRAGQGSFVRVPGSWRDWDSRALP